MFIIKHRRWFFIISVILFVGSIITLFYPGMRYGIDFTGGTAIEVRYTEQRPEPIQVQSAVEWVTEVSSLQPIGEQGYLIRTRELTPQEKEEVLSTLNINGAQYTLERYNSIGPSIGSELRRKSIIAIILVIICIVLFITFAFRKVSEPLPSWKYGLAAIIALAHDVIIPLGAYILWNHFVGGDIDLLFITALLAILGYSVHDTIVVFDRVRENLRKNKEERRTEDFETTVGRSVNETFARSINTSVTIFLVLLALFFFGGEATRHFSFVLLIGVVIGTYSSIFLASPLLVVFEKWQRRA
jgi:preprotein translocase subunit SecF